MKVLISKNDKFRLKDTSKDYHTKHGFFKKEDLKKSGKAIKTNTGKEFSIFNPFFIDLYRKIRRDAQIIPLKDIGLIVAETGINNKSKVVDAGAGSGALCCFLANTAKEVVTYEIREDFIEIVKFNIEFLGLKNIKIKNIDIYNKIEEKNIDVVILDVPEPWNAVDNCSKALKIGGFLVSYSPSVPQVADFVNAVKKNESFVYLKTSEVVEREWEVEERRVRAKKKRRGGRCCVFCFLGMR